MGEEKVEPIVTERQISTSGDSLSITIPRQIVNQLHLKKGDSVVWILTPEKAEEVRAEVEFLRNPTKEK